jgi:hypothetical protein
MKYNESKEVLETVEQATMKIDNSEEASDRPYNMKKKLYIESEDDESSIISYNDINKINF